MGSRVRNVMNELHGEKIDIVDYSDDPAGFVANALSPARVSRVHVVDLAAREAQVIVPDYQLSLAIGKEGQNARLAARLTGWRIDIRSDAAPPSSGPSAEAPSEPSPQGPQGPSASQGPSGSRSSLSQQDAQDSQHAQQPEGAPSALATPEVSQAPATSLASINSPGTSARPAAPAGPDRRAGLLPGLGDLRTR
jgi:N utilization substance protein A